MIKQSYQEAIHELCALLEMPVPSVEVLASVSTRLTEDSIRNLTKVLHGKRTFYSLPPPHSGWQNRLFSADNTLVDSGGRRFNNQVIQGPFEAYRDVKYHRDTDPRGDIFVDHAIAHERVADMRKDWQHQLLKEREASGGNCLEVRLCDPTDLHPPSAGWPFTGRPKTKLVLYIATSRPWNALANDRSKPESELIDDAIVTITDSVEYARKTMDFSGRYEKDYCWRCSGGLMGIQCSGCLSMFKDNGVCGGDYTPPPRTLTNFIIAAGHQFEIDPAIAVAAERFVWELQPRFWSESAANRLRYQA